MIISRRITVLTMLLLASLLVPVARAQMPRQYYAKYWERKGGYFYRTYYFKPAPDQGYREQYVIFYPARPRYFYYYNPDTGKYWGRYDRLAKGYSRLPEDEQNELLSHIPERAFPSPGDMPVLKESTDQLKMEPPPNGLPIDESDALSMEKMSRVAGVSNVAPPRQVYSDWCKQGKYYFCVYYYQPMPAGDYHSHRCIYYPTSPRYIYYYNPYKGKYWGRFDRDVKGYSELADQDKHAKLTEIPDSAFPKPSAMPPIPESKNGPQMGPPPQPPA